MKKIEITVSDKTFEQLEKLVEDLQMLLDSDTVEHRPATKDFIISDAINSAYLKKFSPNPMNIVLIQHSYMQLLDLIKEQKEINREFPIADLSNVEVTPLKIINALIEKDYNRLHNIAPIQDITDEDLPI
ncbi:hypothetical protein [Bacillus thuringiensis]|uniref:hypothetical protein n=1 Tax=Bacillus thuringiensis TaxID=1428 RepID=UPI0021D6692F|nr:hypothetical protein [Bacillus thuringiensis]MCU7667994.1 hypothetical protein [Bacillus thuringiensis]